MAANIKHVEQTDKTVTYHLTDGSKWVCTENDLIQFIEYYGLNIDSVWSHNDSPKNDSDPAYDVHKDIYKDPEVLLDESWEMVTEAYYKHIFRR